MTVYVFGYGSLLHPQDWVQAERAGEPVYGFVRDHLRHFRVGIDNQSSLYDNKHYLFRGQRVSSTIGTLGIDPYPGRRVNGLAIPASDELLEKITRRELSYNISPDISHLFSEPLPGPLLTYYPREENRQLYKEGMRKADIFLPRSYLQYCREGFGYYGGEKDFHSLTDPADYPLADFQFYRQPGAI